MFVLIIQSLIKWSFNNYKFDEIITNFNHIEKYLQSGVSEIEKQEYFDECVLNFGITSKKLLERSAFVEKLKMLSCFVQGVVNLMKNFDFNNLIAYSSKILNENEDIIRKIRLVEKMHECCRFLYECLLMKVNTFVVLIKRKSEVLLEKANYESLTYKLLIDGLKNILDLWNLKVMSYQSYRILKEKQVQVNSIYEVYYKLYGVHQYLNNIKPEKMLLKYNYLSESNEKEEKYLCNYLIELDKIISTIEKTISSRKENVEGTDDFSNQLVVRYCSSLLEIAYTKKIINSAAQFKLLKSVIDSN
jgi:hypothetical protein